MVLECLKIVGYFFKQWKTMRKLTRKIEIKESVYSEAKARQVINGLEAIGYLFIKKTIARPCSTCGKVTLHFEKIIG